MDRAKKGGQELEGKESGDDINLSLSSGYQLFRFFEDKRWGTCYYCYFWKQSAAIISIDFLSSLSSSYHSIKHLRLLSVIPVQSARFTLSNFKRLKILSLDYPGLVGMARGQLGSSLSTVEVFHLSCFEFEESRPHPEKFKEEGLLSKSISSHILPNLKEIFIPLKPIDSSTQEAVSPRSLKLWEEGRKVLREKEMMKNGKIKLRMLQIGETGEWDVKWDVTTQVTLPSSRRVDWLFFSTSLSSHLVMNQKERNVFQLINGLFLSSRQDGTEEDE